MSRTFLACLSVLLVAVPSRAQETEDKDPIAALGPADLEHGKLLFRAHCARCHGYEGQGGEGPSLARPNLRNAPDGPALFGVIQNGIPTRGMPGAWQIGDREIWQVAGYVRSLGRSTVVPSGDAERGRAVYERAGCAACHTVRGAGGALGPELSAVGASRGAGYLRESIVDPGAALPPALWPEAPGFSDYLPVRVVTRAGREMLGMRVNEDAFTLQFRDAAGGFHSFDKRDLKTLEKQTRMSLMPSYANALSASELDDLVAYLASLRGRE